MFACRWRLIHKKHFSIASFLFLFPILQKYLPWKPVFPAFLSRLYIATRVPELKDNVQNRECFYLDYSYERVRLSPCYVKEIGITRKWLIAVWDVKIVDAWTKVRAFDWVIQTNWTRNPDPVVTGSSVNLTPRWIRSEFAFWKSNTRPASWEYSGGLRLACLLHTIVPYFLFPLLNPTGGLCSGWDTYC